MSDDQRQIPNWVENLVEATENRFKIPGVPVRFGYDTLVGLVPGIGDFLGLIIGGAVVVAAYRVEASKQVIARMIGNLALDAAVGSIPVVGDVFDLFFKANRRNLELLRDELEPAAA